MRSGQTNWNIFIFQRSGVIGPQIMESMYSRHGSSLCMCSGILIMLIALVFRRNEGKVLKLYSQKMNVEVFRCGLVINSTLPIFAFTPDGIVVSSSLPSRFLEVKCPTSGQQLSSDELLEKLDYIKIDPSNGTPVLKETHSYYGQIQFGLYLGGVQDADLIIYCERDQDVIVIPVTLNLSFAEEMMFVLRRTFFTNVLPYLFVCRNRLRKELKQVTS